MYSRLMEIGRLSFVSQQNLQNATHMGVLPTDENSTLQEGETMRTGKSTQQDLEMTIPWVGDIKSASFALVTPTSNQ